ncbi:hypothetical protein D3C75_712860 [compost metagenome]
MRVHIEAFGLEGELVVQLEAFLKGGCIGQLALEFGGFLDQLLGLIISPVPLLLVREHIFQLPAVLCGHFTSLQ